MVPRCCSPVPTREDRGSRARDCSFQFVSKGRVFYRFDVRLGGSDPFGASVIDFRMQVSEIVILLGRKSCSTIRGAGHLAMRRAVAKRIAFENFMAPAETETLFSPAEAWGYQFQAATFGQTCGLPIIGFFRLCRMVKSVLSPPGHVGQGQVGGRERRGMIVVRRTAGTTGSCPTWQITVRSDKSSTARVQ